MVGTIDCLSRSSIDLLPHLSFVVPVLASLADLADALPPEERSEIIALARHAVDVVADEDMPVVARALLRSMPLLPSRSEAKKRAQLTKSIDAIRRAGRNLMAMDAESSRTAEVALLGEVRNAVRSDFSTALAFAEAAALARPVGQVDLAALLALLGDDSHGGGMEKSLVDGDFQADGGGSREALAAVAAIRSALSATALPWAVLQRACQPSQSGAGIDPGDDLPSLLCLVDVLIGFGACASCSLAPTRRRKPIASSAPRSDNGASPPPCAPPAPSRPPSPAFGAPFWKDLAHTPRLSPPPFLRRGPHRARLAARAHLSLSACRRARACPRS